MSISLTIPPHPIRPRLWKIGGWMAIFTATLFVANFFTPPQRSVTRDMLGHDFLAFYAAGTLARQGGYRDLYDLTAIKNLESSTARAAGLTTGFGPYWNPPFTARLFAPFTLLSFPRALLLWEAVSAMALIASIALMSRWLPGARDWRNWGLIPLLILTSNPLIAVFTHAQNTCLTLLLMTITAACWRNGRAFLAGLTCGLLLYKPQHAPVLAAACIICLGWRAAAGLAVSAATLAILTLVTMPGAMSDYLHKLPQIALTMQELSPYSWDRHVTLKAFWRLLFQGTDPGPSTWPTVIFWWSSESIVALLLARQLWRARRDPDQTDRAIALIIAAGPLLALFCFDYDLLILAVPAVLCAAQAMRRRTDAGLLAAWIVLFAALHLNMFLARPTHFVLATPALVGVVICLQRVPKPRAQIAAPQSIAPTAIAA